MDHDLELLECPGKVAVGEQIETHDEQMKDVEEMRQAKIKSLEAELRSAHLQLEKLKHKDAEQNDVIRQRDTDILRLKDSLDALQTQMEQTTEKLRSAEKTRDELQTRVTRGGAVAKSPTTSTAHHQPASGCDCPICSRPVTDTKVLSKCNHEFCRQCIDEYFTNTEPVCPVCGTQYGEGSGNQPDGTMEFGFWFGLTTITYRFPGGIQGPTHPNPGSRYDRMKKTAYLHINNEGEKVVGLLRRAFNARLTFTIGRCPTTGKDNQVIENGIDHMTDWGAAAFHQDPGYISRVQQQLAAKGIK